MNSRSHFVIYFVHRLFTVNILCKQRSHDMLYLWKVSHEKCKDVYCGTVDPQLSDYLSHEEYLYPDCNDHNICLTTLIMYNLFVCFCRLFIISYSKG